MRFTMVDRFNDVNNGPGLMIRIVNFQFIPETYFSRISFYSFILFLGSTINIFQRVI